MKIAWIDSIVIVANVISSIFGITEIISIVLEPQLLIKMLFHSITVITCSTLNQREYEKPI